MPKPKILLNLKSLLHSRWLILSPALLVSLFSFVPQAEAFQVGLNAVGYTVTDIPPIKSDTAYVECGRDVVPFINVTFDYEQNLFGDCGWDSFMVHYTGYLQIPEHETLQMWVASDDGGTVKIGTQEFGVWQDQGCSATEFDLSGTPADSYPFDAWFYENGGGTCFMLAWNVDDTGWTIVPPEAFTSEPPTTATPEVSTSVPTTTMPQSTTSSVLPSTTVEPQTTSTVPETTSSTTSSSTTTTSTTTTSTVPVTLYLPPTTTTEPSTTTTEPIPEPQSTTTTTIPEVTTTTEYVTTTSEQPTPTTIPENPTTSVLSPPDEAEPPLSDEELETVLDALETADEAEVQALVDEVLEKDLDTSQAASLVSSPTVLASVTSEQAVALFEEIAPEELTPAEAEAVVEAVQEAPTSVRKAFEAVLNMFEGFADNYVMTGQQVPIKTRRALIALSAVFLTVAPAPSRRIK
jgi:hypothetical protein